MDINNSNLAELNKTKKNISLIFTLAMLFIIILLGIGFFSIKFHLAQSLEYNTLNQVLSITKKIIQEEGIENIEFNKVFRKLRSGFLGNEGLSSKYINLIIINNFTGDIFFEHIQEGIDLNSTLLLIRNNNIIKGNTIKIGNDKYLISKTLIKNIFTIQDLTLYAFSKPSYSLSEYLKELLSYFGTTLILSIIIYFVSFRLTSFSMKSVEESLKDMEQFVHNAGHELKNPIASIYSCIQLIEKTDKNKEYIENSILEIKRIDNLINSLIELTYFNPYKNISLINIENEILKIIKENEIKYKLKNLQIKYDIKKDIFIECNKDYFYILFSNIFFNAIKFSKHDGVINIYSLGTNLYIEDKGIGIKKENIKKVFDRFFKEDLSRSTEGFGIGLSLVKRIAGIYGWKINISSKKGIGTTFIINFKK